MIFKITRAYYWTSLIISVCALLLSFGLGLMALGIIILPIIIYNIKIGINLKRLQDKPKAVFFAASNWLIFALIRPDGVHATSENGLSSMLDIFGISGGYISDYENYYFTFSLLMIVIQIVTNYRLLKHIKLTKE